MKTGILAVLFALGLATIPTATSANTLDDVKARGFLKCGVNTGLPGFGAQNNVGDWTGFDVDYCRAVAAAIFDDPTAVKFTPLNSADRFTALRHRRVDLLSRNTTWTMSRDTQLGLSFVGTSYYDGQGFLVRKSLGVSSALELSGATVCVQTGTTTVLNLADYFRANNMTYTQVAFETLDEVLAAYSAERCDAFTSDASQLYAARLTLANPGDHIVLPEVISKEPLGPVVRQGDDQWLNVVKWVHFALINAEELGVTRANVAEMTGSSDARVRRLLGVDGAFGEGLGLSHSWAANALSAVGNYGEVFERNLGSDSPLGISRGLNALWTKGGIQYAPPIR